MTVTNNSTAIEVDEDYGKYRQGKMHSCRQQSTNPEVREI
jgi:hypothetical protein